MTHNALMDTQRFDTDRQSNDAQMCVATVPALMPAQAGHLEWLVLTGLALARVKNLDQALDTAATHLATLPLLARGYLFLVEDRPLRAGRTVPFGGAPALPPELPLEHSLCAQALDHGYLMAPDDHTVPLLPWERAIAAGASLLCAPFASSMVRGALFGVRSAGDASSTEVSACLQAAADLIGATIERATECDAQHAYRALLARQVHAERLAMIGRLTSALAHEINNPLQAISNSLHLLLTHSLSDEKRQRYLAMAQQEVTDVIATVRHMLDLHRSSEQGMRPVPLRSVLEQALAQAAPVLRQRGIEVCREFVDDDLLVAGIAGHLRHACYNLALNAAHAMPDGGRLTVRTYRQPGNGFGPRVVVEFADTGMPVAADEAPLLFEPYGPTRGDSSGVELPLSYSIVDQHHGELVVRNDAGETVFLMILPAAV